MSRGQALIEFVLVFAFSMLLIGKVVTSVNDFLSDSFGNVAHVLSQNLKTGVCANNCFFGEYQNGFQGE